MISHYIAIGLGGATGAIARVALGKSLPHSLMGIPLQILYINIIGCFIMGMLVKMANMYLPLSDTMKYFLMSGFLGGFTTFSGFALEFGLLFEKHAYITALLYAVLSFTLSILFFFIGIKLASKL